MRSRLQVVHSSSERRQKINLLISTWVVRALTLPRSSNERATRPLCASGVAAATACDHVHRTAAPQTCLPLRLQIEKMSENPRLRRPCSPSWAAKWASLSTGRLHAWHDFETECVVAQLSRPSPISSRSASPSTRSPRCMSCHRDAPRRARPSCSIEWAQHEARLGRPCLPSLVTYRATSRPRPAWRQWHHVQAAWSTPHCAVVTADGSLSGDED